MSQATKVFIISLDGATFDVLRPLVQQGYMPNLGKVLQGGLAAELESVIPPVTAPAWTSFMTGKTPGKHGIFDFTRFDEGDYSWKVNNSTTIGSKTLWQLLSERGKRVIVLNLPYTYPPYQVNGIMVSGWDAPLLGKDFTCPADFHDEILKMMPDYASNLDLPLGSNWPTKSDELFDRFTGKLIRGVEQGTQLSLHLLKMREWDVFMVHFQQTDWIQHNLWSYIEEGCKSSTNKSSWVEKTRQCYKSFDRSVGALLKEIENVNAVKIILSDHGFGPRLGELLPNYFLRQWGYFVTTTNGESTLQGSLYKLQSRVVRTLQKATAVAKQVLVGGEKLKADTQRYISFSEGLEHAVRSERIPLDWSKTKVALVVGSETGLLFVNVKGRAPLGSVDPGAEYETFVSDLIAKFRDLRHPRTGERLFTRVARGSEIYPNSGSGVRLPDIVLIPIEGYGFSYAAFDAVTDAAAPEPATHGGHRPNGVLILEGEGLNTNVTNFHPCLIDIAPTILHMLGLPVPTDMDGRVLTEIFVQERQVRYEEVDNSVQQEARNYTNEETQLVEQRLKALGYMQ